MPDINKRHHQLHEEPFICIIQIVHTKMKMVSHVGRLGTYNNLATLADLNICQ